MKYLSFLLFILLSTNVFSQETPLITNEIREEEPDSVEVSFAVLENVPIYSGCDPTLSNKELKDCMSTRISNLVYRNFDLDLAENLNLPAGKVRIHAYFKIDKEGNIINIKARAPHPELEKEAIRVISLIPTLDKPGIQRGKPVIVNYALPIVFIIEEKILSKKEQRRLKKKNRS